MCQHHVSLLVDLSSRMEIPLQLKSCFSVLGKSIEKSEDGNFGHSMEYARLSVQNESQRKQEEEVEGL